MKKRDCNTIICVAKTKTLISCVVTAQLICAFGFAYANCCFICTLNWYYVLTSKFLFHSCSFFFLSASSASSSALRFLENKLPLFNNLNKSLAFLITNLAHYHTCDERHQGDFPSLQGGFESCMAYIHVRKFLAHLRFFFVSFFFFIYLFF